MSFIDSSYFIRDINLTSQQLDNITPYITIYEEEILKKLLGYQLYTELINDLDGNGDPQTQKFTDFVDGKEFSFTTINGYDITTKWMGLRDSTRLKSLISYYVYFQYRNLNERVGTSVGQKINSSEISVFADVYPQLVYVWNELIKDYGHVYEHLTKYLSMNLDNYKHYNDAPSAYNYLLANKSDFSNWIFEPLDTINIYGI